MPRVVADALDTPEGRRWLHRVLVGLLTLFVLRGGLGVALLHEFLVFTGISRLVASSPSTLQRFARRLREQTVRWGRRTITDLALTMREIPLLLVLDEHWHGGMHLVAYDALSGYLLLQSPSPSRSALAWSSALDGAVKGLRVRVLQTVGDDALGLSTCSINGVRVVHCPDLFHPLYAITRAFGPPIAHRVRRAESETARTYAVVARFDAAARPDATIRRPRGTREKAVTAHQEAVKSLEQAKQVQEALRTQVRAAGAAAHPIEPATAQWNTRHSLREALRAPRDKLRKWARTHGLDARIAKALSHWTSYAKAAETQLTHLRARAETAVATLAVPANVQTFVLEHLIPLAYLLVCHARSESSEERAKLRSIVSTTLARWRSQGTVWSTLSRPVRAQLLEFSMRIASTFVRSSSGIEGHNGRSSLWWHQRSRMDPLELEARQILHNFVPRDRDGTTRAQRLFRQPHRSLLSWLCDNVRSPDPPRRGAPSSRRIDLRAEILVAL